MKNLSAVFQKTRSEGRLALIAYITAGDPHLEATVLFSQRLAEAGVDILELGVPFSDPVADGPTNQRAAERALQSGTHLKGILESVLEMRRRGVGIPIVLFTYYNPLLAFGLSAFAHQAAVAGVQGVLCVDLPPEEAASYREHLKKAGIDTIFLASPMTQDTRLNILDKSSSGFLYYVSRTGVTGVQESLSENLLTDLVRVRRQVKNPLAVGFGISTPEQVAHLRLQADAVVVGSAFVKRIEEGGQPEQIGEKLFQFARSLRGATR